MFGAMSNTVYFIIETLQYCIVLQLPLEGKQSGTPYRDLNDLGLDHGHLSVAQVSNELMLLVWTLHAHPQVFIWF